MKKILSIFLSICTLCLLMPTVVFAQTYGDFEYTVSDNTVTITKYKGSDKVLAIPSQIDGKNVIAIGKETFKNCWELKSVSIPAGITSIGEDAFYHCTGLESITVDNNNLAYSSSSDGVFFNKNKTELIQYPAGKTGSSYSVPDSVTSIGKSAFGYSKLTSIFIPASVFTIEEAAFEYNDNLSSVNFAENSQVDSIKSRTFDTCKSLTSITIPDSVKSIGYRAFYSCSSLESVIFGNDSNLISIGYEAFEYCNNLSNITIPDKVTTIEGCAFLNCNSLTSVEIPYSIQNIKRSAFWIGNLNCIFLPNKEISIEGNAFVKYTTQVKYNLNNNKATITEIILGEGKSHVVIPKTICGYEVVGVADEYQQYVDTTNHICTDYVWTGNDSQYWEKCAICGKEKEGTRKDLPVITINAPDTVCRTQDTKVSVSLPEGIKNAALYHEFSHSGGEIDLDASDGLNGKLSGGSYINSENSFDLVVYATTADGYSFSVRKTVNIQNEHVGGVTTCTKKAICDTCKEEYGELDLTNHDLKHINSKEATASEEGNIEYWTCKGCEKYFLDEEGTKEIQFEDTIISKKAPEIIKGKGQSVNQGEKKELSFTSNASYDDFKYVKLDGNELDPKNYTVKEGSTIVTLNKDFVSTLKAGKHILTIVSETGEASVEFTVNKTSTAKPSKNTTNTGLVSNIGLWISLIFTSLDAMCIGLICRKRKMK